MSISEIILFPIVLLISPFLDISPSLSKFRLNLLDTILSIGPFPGPMSYPKNDLSLFIIVTLHTPPIFRIAKGKSLELSLGFSHSISVEPIGENKLSVEEQTTVIVDGIDKEHVGRQAAKIRSLRKPNPFTGKGIKYVGEEIRRKSGKSAVGAGGTE